MRISAPKPDRRLDLIVHPTRTRIIVALAGRQLTTGELAELLRDVPQASLYRHVRILKEAGAIEVAETRHSAGKPEKVFQLVEGAGQLRKPDFRSRDDHVTAFSQFASMLAANFRTYVDHADFDYSRDFAYMLADPVQLTSAEFDELAAAIRDLIEERVPKVPTPGSTRRLLAMISIPEKPVRE